VESSSTGKTLSRPGLELVAASFAVLFQELALIRWIPTQVRVAAYFPNLVLLAAFLGLGLGALSVRRKPFLWFWPVSLIVLAGVTMAMSGVAFTATSASEHLWLLYYDLGPDAPLVEGVRLPIVALFVMVAATFAPLGQYVGERLDLFRVRSNALWGYSLDLAGSLAGVIIFAIASFLHTPPVVWFAILTVPALALVQGRLMRRVFFAAGFVVVVVGVHASVKGELFSPYYALSVGKLTDKPGFAIMANGSLHQAPIDLANATVAANEAHSAVRTGYHRPYGLLESVPRKILILGAGSGNDIAVALDEGVEIIHAVEIDPVILDIGRKIHPNRPFDSPNVTVFNTDARTYLNDTDEVYDLIVFGTLDSMTRLSALSNVRLDNFVYTKESIDAARARLAPDGGMVLYFMVGEEYIRQHLMGMLGASFGDLPVIEIGGYQLFNTIYMAGPAFASQKTMDPAVESAMIEELTTRQWLPSDDWPYLYLPRPALSGFYISLMLIFTTLAVVGVMWVSPEVRKAALSRGAIDWEMFLYGAAFLLIETKFVTAINLVWGATWLTSAVVFGSILLTVLLGTLLMAVTSVPWRVAAVGLIVSLLVTYLVPVGALIERGTALRLLLSVAYVGTPVFFASICFAHRFKTRAHADLAFGWNLLGAVVGGLTEFLSMSVGLKALSLIAVVAYLVAFLLYEREGSRDSGAIGGQPSGGP